MKEALARAALEQMFVAQTPPVIVVVSDTRRSLRRYEERGVHFFSITDGSFAAMLILLAVVNEDLGACFVGSFYDEEVQDVLGLPPEVCPIGVVLSATVLKDRSNSRADPRPRSLSAIGTEAGDISPAE